VPAGLYFASISFLRFDRRNMHGIKGFILTFAAMNGLGFAALAAQTSTLQTVPLSADIDVVSVRVLSDGNTLRQERKMKFYRRADGSTRLEGLNRVVIVDNNSHTVMVLDTTGKVAQVQNARSAPANGKRQVAARSQLQTGESSLDAINSPSNTDLGVKVIEGHSVRGIQRTTTIQANSALGNSASITKTIQVWSSSDLRLPLLTVISDPLGGTMTSQYENISTASPPDSSLFTIPAGYKVAQSPQSRVVASHTN
jgi:hypothetical protein